MSPLILLGAFILDCLLGETNRYHPLVGFGNIANKIESIANKSSMHHKPALHQWGLRLRGALAWAFIVLPLPALYFWLHQDSLLFWLFDIAIVYLAIGYNSLVKHAAQIAAPLAEGNMTQARHFCGYIVSRDTSALSEHEIARATTESVLENGHDAVIATLVWFCIGGAPLVILHRLANTLDAMWGYKNTRFLHFGWFAARMDDVLGWPTAKISSLLYACQGNIAKALTNGFKQGRQYKSLNGGWAMASGATVLNITLGGTGIYHGKAVESVALGQGPAVQAKDIQRSLDLVRNAALIFIASQFLLLFVA